MRPSKALIGDIGGGDLCCFGAQVQAQTAPRTPGAITHLDALQHEACRNIGRENNIFHVLVSRLQGGISEQVLPSF